MQYMITKPPAPMSFRFAPEVKALLEKAAALDHRSQANFLESLIRTYCLNHDIFVNASVAPTTNKTSSKKGLS